MHIFVKINGKYSEIKKKVLRNESNVQTTEMNGIKKIIVLSNKKNTSEF